MVLDNILVLQINIYIIDMTMWSFICLWFACVNRKNGPLIHQGIICCVVFGRSSLRRIVYTISVVAPRRLPYDASRVISTFAKSIHRVTIAKFRR
jgi:hypothetical protein